jgi:hypothetical protein
VSKPFRTHVAEVKEAPSLPVLQSGTGLPFIKRPLDNTALQAYMACPREYWLSMVQHRRGTGLSPALSYGLAMHTALEHHYKSGGNEDIVEMMVRAKWKKHDSSDDYRTLDRVILDYQRYRKKYGADPSKEPAKTVGWPTHPMVELSTNAVGGGLIHPWAVKIDRIIELNGLGYVEDHKSTSRLDKNYFKSFELSNQMMGYLHVAQQLVPSLKIVGVRINVIHCLSKETNFERMVLTFSPDQMQEWVENTNQWMERLNSESKYWYLQEEIAKLRDEPIPFPIAHFGDNGCSRKYGLCGYHRVCSVSSRIRHQMLENEFPVNPWNPLEADDE